MKIDPYYRPLTPKYMTSNDLEILNGHFTLSFHYYEARFQQLGYILTVESVYTSDQRRCAEEDRDPQNLEFAEKLRIFSLTLHRWTLTNKANISI